MKNTTAELVLEAELEAFNLPDNREPERSNLTPLADQLEAIEQREELIEALSHVVVSEAVRRECQAEMAEGARTGWRI
jgi:hypothetical protein